MSHQKKLEPYEEMAEYKFRVGNVQNEPKISHCVTKQKCIQRQMESCQNNPRDNLK